MKKILIAFLMFTLSGPAFIAPTPTFADEATLLAAVERFANNRANKSKQTHVQNCNATLKTTKDIVGTGSTAANAEKEWRTNAKLFLKQYCINPPQKDTYVSCNSTGGGAITNCNDTCGDAKEINRFAREICQNILEQTKKDDPGIKFDQFDSSVPAVVTTQDNTYGFIARLQGSNATPTTVAGGTKSTTPVTVQSAASVVGKVVDENNQPVFSANVQLFNNDDFITGEQTDMNGKFTFNNTIWQPTYSLKITYVGYKDAIINTEPNESLPIQMQEDSQELAQIDIGSQIKQGDTCTIIKNNKNITGTLYTIPGDNDKYACKPTTCEYSTYKATKLSSGTCLDGNETYTCNLFECELDTSLDKTDKDCANINDFDKNATRGTVLDWDEFQDKNINCTSTACVAGFVPGDTDEIVNEKVVQRCRKSRCNANDFKNLLNPYTDQFATSGVATAWDSNGNITRCTDITCPNGYLRRNVTDTNGTLFQKCGQQCNCDEDFDLKKWQCVPARTDKETQCNTEEVLKSLDEHATRAKFECNGKESDDGSGTLSACKITACADGYRVDGDKCKKIPTRDEIDALQAQVDASRANERTLEHRINDAVGIGGVGIGGMMIGGALSERSADDAAESDMRAYINTFRCEYGNGQNVAGGTTNVEIPGGNELIDLYARYATLANDLKLRKTSLGIKPGIESEVIIDKAASGLYDDVGTGVVGGGYASIARAIMNPTGADAQMWAAQRAATTSKLNTGIGIATTAAALTLGKTIADEFTKPKDAIQNAQQAIQEIPNKEPTCSDFDLEGTYPNCTCKEQNHKFVGGDIICQECGNGQQIVVDSNTGWQKCECPNGYWSTRFNSCRQEHLTCEEQGFNTNNVPYLKVHMTSDGVCRFSCGTYNLIGDETDPNTDHSCECPNDGEHQDTGEKCIQVQTINNENISIYEKKDLKLDSETFFAFSDHKLKDQNAKDVLTNFAKDIVDDSTVQSCIMIIYGHTDKAGDDYSNERLATRRIASVTDVFNKVDKFKDKVHIIEKPVGEKECKCAAQDDDHPTTPAPDPFGACEGKNIGDTTFDKNYAPCRHVDIDVECKTNQLNKI